MYLLFWMEFLGLLPRMQVTGCSSMRHSANCHLHGSYVRFIQLSSSIPLARGLSINKYHPACLGRGKLVNPTASFGQSWRQPLRISTDHFIGTQRIRWQKSVLRIFFLYCIQVFKEKHKGTDFSHLICWVPMKWLPDCPKDAVGCTEPRGTQPLAIVRAILFFKVLFWYRPLLTFPAWPWTLNPPASASWGGPRTVSMGHHASSPLFSSPVYCLSALPFYCLKRF